MQQLQLLLVVERTMVEPNPNPNPHFKFEQ